MEYLEKNKSPSKLYTDAVKTVERKITNLRQSYDNKKEEVLTEAKKIIGLAPVTVQDLEHIFNNGVSKLDLLEKAVSDFLKYELKLDDTEIQGLNLIKVTRPKKENSDHMYLHFSNRKASQYLYRTNCKNK